MTVYELAKAHGLESFDSSLPITWVDQFVASTGFEPFGHFVWCYDKVQIWGEPYPLTEAGKVALDIYKHIMKED